MQIKTFEGEIDSAVLDGMIESARSTYDITTSVESIRELVIMDYDDSDISQVTVQDIVEICNASFDEDDGQPSSYEEYQDLYGGDDAFEYDQHEEW